MPFQMTDLERNQLMCSLKFWDNSSLSSRMCSASLGSSFGSECPASLASRYLQGLPILLYFKFWPVYMSYFRTRLGTDVPTTAMLIHNMPDTLWRASNVYPTCAGLKVHWWRHFRAVTPCQQSPLGNLDASGQRMKMFLLHAQCVRPP